jgi:hypothetical protein
MAAKVAPFSVGWVRDAAKMQVAKGLSLEVDSLQISPFPSGLGRQVPGRQGGVRFIMRYELHKHGQHGMIRKSAWTSISTER